MKQLLPKLAQRLHQFYPIASKIPVTPLNDVVPVAKDNNQEIVHSYFWPRVGKFFLPKDVVVTETGMS